MHLFYLKLQSSFICVVNLIIIELALRRCAIFFSNDLDKTPTEFQKVGNKWLFLHR